jgi:hypothetical protein
LTHSLKYTVQTCRLQQEMGDKLVAAHPQMLDAVLAMSAEAVKKVGLGVRAWRRWWG